MSTFSPSEDRRDCAAATVEIEVSEETMRRLRWLAERMDCTPSAALEVVLTSWFGPKGVPRV